MDAATLAACTGASHPHAERYVAELTEAMLRFSIRTVSQQAAFLATVSVESARLTKVEEGLYYRDAQRLVDIFPRAFKGDLAKAQRYTKNPTALGGLLYPGGFWGRGLIQITWLENYLRCGRSLGFDYVATPALLVEPWHAAMSAAWYWDDAGCNDPADRGDMDDVTRRVNGPKKMHLAERKAQNAIASAVLS